MKEDLVSIIVPVYNRAHLIKETLQSIIDQTYNNWECIIVDDRSSDSTCSVVKHYVKKDNRIRLYERPMDRPSGANACRNYGVEVSQGSYINWFDSDDLMENNRLEIMLSALVKWSADFCIDEYCNFTDATEIYPEKAFEKNNENSLSLRSYLFHTCYWGTINFLGRREFLNSLKFDECLASGQEYNFFVQMYALKTNIRGLAVQRPLSKRRIHRNSIQHKQSVDDNLKIRNKFYVYYRTLTNYKEQLKLDECLFLLEKSVLLFHSSLVRSNNPISIYKFIVSNRQFFKISERLIIHLVFLSAYLTGKGDVKGKELIRTVFKRKKKERINCASEGNSDHIFTITN